MPPAEVAGYKINVPEPLKEALKDWDQAGDEKLQAFLGKAHKSGLTQSQLDVVMSQYYETISGMQPVLTPEQQAEKAAEALSEVWKEEADFDRNVQAAYKASAAFAKRSASLKTSSMPSWETTRCSCAWLLHWHPRWAKTHRKARAAAARTKRRLQHRSLSCAPRKTRCRERQAPRRYPRADQPAVQQPLQGAGSSLNASHHVSTLARHARAFSLALWLGFSTPRDRNMAAPMRPDLASGHPRTWPVIASL